MNTVKLLLLLSVTAGILILYLPIMAWLVNSWLNNPFYSHGFLIPAVSAFIAWRNLSSLERADAVSGDFDFYSPGFGILSLGLALLVLGYLRGVPSLGALSFLFTMSGVVLYLYGRGVMRSVFFPIAFLIFAIPPPGVLLDAIASHLQTISATYSAAIVMQLGIPVDRVGAEIHLRNTSLVVGLPCSGMNSVIALLALSALFVYLLKCSWYKKTALVLASIAFAIFANILRIVFLLLLGNSYGAETATGFFHTLFSPLLFIIAFLFLILLSIVIGCRVRRGAPDNG